MEKNCYFSMLHGRVDADLEKYGEAVIVIPPNADFTLYLGNYTGQKIIASADVDIYSATIYVGKEYVIQGSSSTASRRIVSGNTGGTLTLYNKYLGQDHGSSDEGLWRKLKFGDDLKSRAYWMYAKDVICDANPEIKGDIEDLKGFKMYGSFTRLASIGCVNLSGDVVEFLNDNPNVKNVGVSDCPGLYGNVELITNTNITSMNTQNTGMEGTIEGFVAAQRSAGRTTGTIRMSRTSSKITYESSPVPLLVDLSWTADSIALTPYS